MRPIYSNIDEKATVFFFIMAQSKKTPLVLKLKHLGDLFSVNTHKR